MGEQSGTGHENTPDAPTAGAESRLREALLLWHRAAASYFEPEEFRTYVNACIQALRNVTWLLQQQKDAIPHFDEWYDSWRKRLRADPVMTWLVDARNQVVKQGDLKTRSLARVAVVASYFDPPTVELEIDPLTPGTEIAGRVDLEGVPAEIRADGYIRVERRWVAADLPAFELLDALAHAFASLSALVRDAKQLLKGSAPAGESDEGQRGLADYLRRLPPSMQGASEFRTVCFRISDGGILHVRRQSFVPEICPEMVRDRYPEIDLVRPAQFGIQAFRETCAYIFETAKNLLKADGYHVPIAFLFLPNNQMMAVELRIDEHIDKYLLWPAIAKDVELMQAEGVVAVSESWVAPYDPRHPFRRPGDSPEREEALGLDGISKTGSEVAFACRFTRQEGKMTFGETMEDDHVHAAFLEPIRRVWKRDTRVTLDKDAQFIRLSEDLITSTRVVNIPVSSVPPDSLAQALTAAATSHHLDGAAVANKPPLFLFKVSHAQDATLVRRLGDPRLNPSPIALITYPWPGRFGGLLTITAMGMHPHAQPPSPFVGAYPRVCLRPGTPASEALKAGSLLGVFAYDDIPVGAIRVTYESHGPGSTPVHRALDGLASHEPDLADCEAAYWEVLKSLTIYERFLTVEDRLSLGWISEYLRYASGFGAFLEAVKAELSSAGDLSAMVSPATGRLIDVLQKGEWRPEPVMTAMAELYSRGGSILYELCERSLTDLAKAARTLGLEELPELPSFALDVFLLSSRVTRAGLALPWLASDGQFHSLALAPRRFPVGFVPEEYWDRIGGGLRLNLGLCVSGADIPAALKSDDELRELGPLEEGVGLVQDQADEMLRQLSECGETERLDGAHLEVGLVEFRRMEVKRLNDGLYCVLRNGRDEFIVVCVEPGNGYCEIIFPGIAFLGAQRGRAMAGVRLRVTEALLRQAT